MVRVWEIDKVVELQGERKDYICCSVCFQYKAKESFGKVENGRFVQSRTNCYDCYMIGESHWSAISEAAFARRISPEAQQRNKEFLLELEKKAILAELECHSISVQDLISQLSQLPKDSKIVLRLEGPAAINNFEPIKLEPCSNLNKYNVNVYSLATFYCEVSSDEE